MKSYSLSCIVNRTISLKKAYGFILLCVLGFSQHNLAQSRAAAPAYQLKAAFLYNFTRFIEWPAGEFASPNSPFIITVLDDDNLGKYLTEITRGERVGSHPILVRNIYSAKDIGDGQILFVGQTAKLKEPLNIFAAHHTLTVGDSDNFLSRGGIVRFYTENNKIRIQINTSKAEAAQLQISSKLLNIVSHY